MHHVITYSICTHQDTGKGVHASHKIESKINWNINDFQREAVIVSLLEFEELVGRGGLFRACTDSISYDWDACIADVKERTETRTGHQPRNTQWALGR